MRRAAAAVVLVLSACGGGSEPGNTVPANRLCAGLVEAACDREAPCGTFPDRATCIATLSDTFDGCPLAVSAVAMGEADYDPTAAARLLDAVRAGACGSAVPDFVSTYRVFTPKLGAGATCHSDVSCMAGLTCSDLTIEEPQGTCTAI